MDSSRLMPESIDGEKKQKAVKDAKDMQQFVLRTCERNNFAVPPYDFIELIGKGGSARVYKCKEKQSGDTVAVKIVSTDEYDYNQPTLDKDDTIRDFKKEVKTLQQLKETKAKNINLIRDAFDLSDSLWIISDYCSGGSVRTLMRAQPASQPGLEEQYIIPIARELAVAIKEVHDIGVIHRDIKCTNLYVTEEGEIQLGDFGIVGVTEDGSSKRRTMIGTPHYMPPQMLQEGVGNQSAEEYGQEVDIWSYGISVYEMATGQPPYANARDPRMLYVALQKAAPRLEGGNYSAELRDFVASCLTTDPQQRPTAEQVLKHPFIANSQKRYPTKKLVELIHRFKMWEYSGGWRQSLFMAGGAPPVPGTDDSSDDSEDFDDWNFSVSDSFNADFGQRYSQMLSPQVAKSGQGDATAGTDLHPLITNLSRFEAQRKQWQDEKASRGERSLDRIFTPDSAPYELHTPSVEPDSDLPLRSYSGAPTRESTVMIDLDSAHESGDGGPNFNFDFEDLPTMKARSSRHMPVEDDEDDVRQSKSFAEYDKRATMDWKFPSTASKPTMPGLPARLPTKPPAIVTSTAPRPPTMDWKFPSNVPHVDNDKTDDDDGDELLSDFRPMLKHSATEPIGLFREFPLATHSGLPKSSSPIRDSMASMIDLDILDPAELERPSTATSNADSISSQMTSGNPFDLEEDPAQNELDRSRYSLHKHFNSEGGQVKRSSRRSVPMHDRGSSLSSTASDMDRSTTTDDDLFDYEYERRMSQTLRPGMNGITSTLPSTAHWAQFPRGAGFDKTRGYTDPLDDMVVRQRELDRPEHGMWRPSSRASATNGEQPEIGFPPVVPPDQRALREDAEDRLVMDELSRLLDEFTDSCAATAGALQAITAIDEYEDYSSVSEQEHGSGSGAQTTGDEDGY